MHEIIKNILSIKASKLSPELDNLKDILAEAQIEDFKEYISCVYQGSTKLTFNKVNELNWPSWLPNYVQKLYGISGFSHDHIGSYAEAFNGEESKENSLCWVGLLDDECEVTTQEVSYKTFPFQIDHYGHLYHITENLSIIYWNNDGEVKVLASLSKFTKVCIEQALKGNEWQEGFFGPSLETLPLSEL